jgi:restriction system protein
MARKDESILDQLVECPWWVSILVSAAVFLGLRYLLPALSFGGVAANTVAKGLSQLAPIVALILLIPAPIAALNSWRKRRLLDSQKGIDSIRALAWRELKAGRPQIIQFPI